VFPRGFFHEEFECAALFLLWLIGEFFAELAGGFDGLYACMASL